MTGGALACTVSRMPENKNLNPPATPPTTATDGLSPYTRLMRPGVRWSGSNHFPGGKFCVPSTADRAARGGQIQEYDSMGKVATPKVGKNMKGGR